MPKVLHLLAGHYRVVVLQPGEHAERGVPVLGGGRRIAPGRQPLPFPVISPANAGPVMTPTNVAAQNDMARTFLIMTLSFLCRCGFTAVHTPPEKLMPTKRELRP